MVTVPPQICDTWPNRGLFILGVLAEGAEPDFGQSLCYETGWRLMQSGHRSRDVL